MDLKQEGIDFSSHLLVWAIDEEPQSLFQSVFRRLPLSIIFGLTLPSLISCRLWILLVEVRYRHEDGKRLVAGRKVESHHLDAVPKE